MVKRTATTRPYPNDTSLTRAAVELCRAYPDAQARILRGLDLARAGGVADTCEAPQDQDLVTRVNGHLAVFAPNTPYGWVCACQDFYFGASTRALEAAAAKDPSMGRPAFDPMLRACKHLLALRIVADARTWETRPQALRRPRTVTLLDVDPATLRLVA